MREYAKLSPTFWTGETGKALRRRGSEGVIAAVYLISSPHSNMLGLYYQPIAYMGYETGLGEEGARKGLQHCIDVGFCSYDENTEMVFVHEMAGWQISEELKAADKRCKGIQRDYESLPENPFLGPFFDRYAKAFHLCRNRAAQRAPSKPHRSQEQEQEQDSVSDGANAPSSSAQRTATRRPTIPCPYSAIVDAYHLVLPDLPKVRLRDGPAWTDRQAAMRKLWGWVLSSKKSDGSPRATSAEDALGWITSYFRRASENDFVMGRTPRAKGHEGWVCDIDFLLSKGGLKQVIEKTQERTA